MSDAMSCDHERQGSVEMLMDDHLASSQCGAPLGSLDLHDQVVKVHGVVSINGALESLCEYHLQVPVPAGYERRTQLRCRHREAPVELGDVVLVEKLVGPFQSSDPAQSQLLRQASLPGREVPFRAAPRLRRVGRNHMHAEFLHGTADLRGTLIIDLATALRRQPEMGPTVGIERTEQPLLFNHRTQPNHHWGGRFLLSQLRIVDLAGGVVQDHDQVVPTLILKPLVIAAIDMQHHPRQWTPLAPLAMYAPPGHALHQAGGLQRLLDPRVAQPDLMVLAELLMKMPHVQIEVLVPVQAENLFGLLLRNAPSARCSSPPIQQPLVALLLQPLPPTTHLPIADAHQLSRLPPLDLPRCGS